MDIDDSKLYSLDTAPAVLNCTRSWLRDQVTAGTVPHGRLGKRKGVFFTADDLKAILETRRRPARVLMAEDSAPRNSAPPVSVPDRFAGLRSARA